MNRSTLTASPVSACSSGLQRRWLSLKTRARVRLAGLSGAALLLGLEPSLAVAQSASFTADVSELSPAGEPVGYFLPPGGDYDPAIPTPEAFFGFPLGSRHLRAEQIHAYAEALAQLAPKRLSVQVLGRSHEARPLLLVTITAPENHARLEEIRRAHVLAWEKPEADSATRRPIVVNVGYSVHGNEPSAGNAVPAVLYHLAAARGPQHEQLLRDLVILLEPIRNPDGFDRFAQWANSHRGLHASDDPASREHLEVWPRGRTNHYWFDLNRDWLPLVHPESRARIEFFHAWRPHLLTDHHEMGTARTFFFQPGIATRNNPSIDPTVVAFHKEVGVFHEKALNRLGSLYYTGESFDDFYPGKGSTYPDLHGTIGILFEQGSSRGHVQESEHGPLTFAFTIRNQVATSFSSFAAAQSLREEFLRRQREHLPLALAAAKASPVQAWVFGDVGDPARTAALLDLLLRHRIEVRPLQADVSVDGQTFVAGQAWVVPAQQPQFRLAHEFFTRRTTFPDPTFYDVSAWSPVLGFALPQAALAQTPTVGEPLTAAPVVVGRLEGTHAGAYAYILDWSQAGAPRALHRLQKAGVFAKGSTLPFTIPTAGGSRSFPAGTVMIPVTVPVGQPPTLPALIDEAIRRDGVVMHVLATGRASEGIDVGSPSYVSLPKPVVALLTGEGVDANDAGDAWYVLDQRGGLPVTHLEIPQIARVDLSRYQAIVLPDGNYTTLPDAAVEALRRWQNEGGTLVALGRAVSWAIEKKLGKVEVATPPNETRERAAWATADDAETRRRIAGAVFLADLDLTHPLAFGLTRRELPLFRTGTLTLKTPASPYETAARYTEKPLAAGYAPEEATTALAKTPALIAQPQGRGALVLMPDNPTFRGYWRGAERILLNAVFYGRAIRGPRGDGGDEEN